MSAKQTTSLPDPWPHRIAVLLACLTFPLIWIGGLVTTYDAGMAVPDWPSTYGYNLFLYPWSTWIAGPWDLFIEHGHRLLASVVGVIAIALVVATWCLEPRRCVRLATLGGLALVIFQGVLGGMRVRLDERHLAQIHGIVGPLFFAYVIYLCTITSTWWQQADGASRFVLRSERNLAWGVVVLALAQLLVGSQVRHVNGRTIPELFQWAVRLHVAFAIALLILGPTLAFRLRRQTERGGLVSRPAAILAMAIEFQLLLGIGSWLVKFGRPAVLAGVLPKWSLTLEAESMTASLCATAHVANGAFVLALSVLLALRTTAFAIVGGCNRPKILEGATT